MADSRLVMTKGVRQSSRGLVLEQYAAKIIAAADSAGKPTARFVSPKSRRAAGGMFVHASSVILHEDSRSNDLGDKCTGRD